MNQRYVYRKHLRAPGSYIVRYALILYLGIILMVAGILMNDESMPKDGLVFAIFGIVLLVILLFISLELLLMYHLFMKRFKSISVELEEDAIVYTNSKGQQIIPYRDITMIKFPSIKYTGGWMKIIYKGGNVRLTVVLENIGDFSRELKKKLQENEMEYVYNEKKLFSFYKTAVFADESWERVYRNYKMQLVTFYLSIIVTSVVLWLNGSTGNDEMMIFGSVLIPLLGYVIGEIIIGMKVKKRVDREELRILPGNPETEQKIFLFSFILFTIGYFVLVLMSVL